VCDETGGKAGWTSLYTRDERLGGERQTEAAAGVTSVCVIATASHCCPHQSRPGAGESHMPKINRACTIVPCTALCAIICHGGPVGQWPSPARCERGEGGRRTSATATSAGQRPAHGRKHRGVAPGGGALSSPQAPAPPRDQHSFTGTTAPGYAVSNSSALIRSIGMPNA
jgi:hypothetical protein